MTKPWWEQPWAIVVALVVATVPLWFVSLPPLIDLLAHIGRYHIQLHLAESPALQANWAFEWRLLGNLGVDLLMEPLGRLFGVERGALIAAGMLPPVMIWGMVRLARAAHGNPPATTWAAFPFALAYPWQYGLVNYWMGVALALHAAAFFWNRPNKGWTDALILGAATLALWVVHLYGCAIFILLLGIRTVTMGPVEGWFGRTLRLWPLATPLIPMLLLGYGARGAQETYGWFMWARKFGALMFTLRDQWQPLDIASLVLAVVLIYAGVRSRAFRLDRGLGWSALALLAAIAIIPFQALGSAFADGRLWPVAFIVALLSIRTSNDTPVATSHWIAVASAAVFVIRLAATTGGFIGYDQAYARHLKALDHIAYGSRVAVFVNFPCDVEWRRPRLDHLDGIAIARRDVFTNAQWDVPGAQLLTPIGARGTRYNADPSQLVRRPDCPDDLRPVLATKIAQFPRDRFDRVWVIGFRPETLPRYPGLTPLFADDRTILYRIDK